MTDGPRERIHRDNDGLNYRDYSPPSLPLVVHVIAQRGNEDHTGD